MTNTSKFLSVVILISCLSGCKSQDKFSYSYLIHHPDVLKQEVEQCQELSSKSPEQTKNCEAAVNVATKYMSTLSAEQQDPEKFGEDVLSAEEQLSKTKLELETARINLQRPAADNVKIAQANYDKLREDYHAQRNAIQLMLAVIKEVDNPN